MAIDWGLAKAPLTNTPSGGSLAGFATGLQEGAKTSILQNQADITAQEAKNAPQMADMQRAVISGALKKQDLENAMSTYTMAQNILAPSAMAARNGDMQSAADIYSRGVQALKSAGVDPKTMGAPEEFDPAFVQSAFTNVTQQMAMAKQMLDMAQAQSNIDYRGSQVDRNQAEMAKIGYETGLGGGAFSFPGQAASQGGGANMSGLSGKAQTEVRTEQAKEAIKARSALATQANAARANIGMINEGLDILDKHPTAAGRPGLVTQFTSAPINRLGAVYDQLKLNKIGTDYANQGLGPLDQAVSKVLFATTAGIADPYENQKVSLQNSLVASKGIIMNNDIATKLNEAGIYDENVRAKIGQQIAAKLNIKEGSKLNLQNFKNSDKVIDEVLQKNGITTGTTSNSESNPLTDIQMQQREKALAMGADPAKVDEYFARLAQKQ